MSLRLETPRFCLNGEEMFVLNELEEDALKEFFNMGLGMAANSLSQMVDTEILLSLPKLKVVHYEQAIDMLEADGEEKMVAVRQNFTGELTGTALLIFPGVKGLELVRTLLKEDIPLDVLSELEQETLLDVGNVILNAFLVSFTQMMDLDFEFESADFLRGSSTFLLNIASHLADQRRHLMGGDKHYDEQAFLLMMDFKTSDENDDQHTLHGFVVLLFSQEAMAVLKRELSVILSKL